MISMLRFYMFVSHFRILMSLINILCKRDLVILRRCKLYIQCFKSKLEDGS
jgi:hypothetical protein